MSTIKRIYFSDSYVMDVTIVLMGATVLTLFYSLLAQGFFTASIFTATLTEVAQYSGPHVKQFISLLIANSAIIAPLLGVTMFSAAILLILLIARGTMATLTGIGFLIAWIVLWRYPGMWTYELLFPALFGICAGLSKLGYPSFGLSIYHQLSLSKSVQVVIILFLSLLLGYVTYLAEIHNIGSYKLAISSGLTFLLISYVHLGIDPWLKNKKNVLQFKMHVGIKKQIAEINWLDVMIIVMGSMMVAQVYSNYYSGLYTVKGFADLGDYYATATATVWLSPFLAWAGHHSSLLLPLFIVYEIVVASLLVLLVFRGPITLLASGLFFLLAFAEFGVSSTWPPTPGFYNGQWQLLLPALVSLLISLGKFEEIYHAPSWKKAIWGSKTFYSLSMLYRILIAAVSAIALYFTGMVTQIFGSPYVSISISASITFFILLVLLSCIDKYRSG